MKDEIFVDCIRANGRKGRYISITECLDGRVSEFKLNETPKIEVGEFKEADLSNALFIDLNTAQGLFDSMWDSGLRPSDGAGNIGQLKATQNHLSDIKEIAYHVLKINK
jgi:hypothetical protein